MERISRFQSDFSAHRHRLAVPAESALAQSGIAGSGDPGAFAATASCFDARLSGGVVGVAVSALPSSRVFARAVFPRDDFVHLHILYSAQWIYTLALPWYALAPFNAHLIAAMNVATIALIRVGYERTRLQVAFGFVFVAALFIAFASAPITSMTYVPVYAVLWLAFLIPLQAQRRVVLWRWGTIASALLVLGIDRSTVLSGRDRHDVGTRGHLRRRCSIPVGSCCRRHIGRTSYPIFRFARTRCN